MIEKLLYVYSIDGPDHTWAINTAIYKINELVDFLNGQAAGKISGVMVYVKCPECGKLSACCRGSELYCFECHKLLTPDTPSKED